MITWVTLSKASKSVVEYGERGKMPLTKRAYGSLTEYETCGWKKRIIHIHRVKLEELVPGGGYGKKKKKTIIFIVSLTEFMIDEFVVIRSLTAISLRRTFSRVREKPWERGCFQD